jgi:peptidoglycan/LPS O-acetylase OafA/YrhL
MSETPRRIPQLDGIRGTAISLVVIWHFIVVPITQEPHEGAIARFIAHAGLLTWSGVDLFFVLSGFLIGGILIDAKESSNYFRTFYVRRVFRILPIYMVVVIAYLLLWNVATGHRPLLQESLGRPMPWYVYLTFTQNFWLAHNVWDCVYLTVSWSLAVEEQFYLLLPSIIRILPKQSLLSVASALALSSAITRCLLYLYYGPSWGTAAYTLIFSRADALMIGVICAALLRDRRRKELLIRNLWAIKASFVVFGLGVTLFTYEGWGMGTREMCTLGLTCLALFYGSALMIAMVSPQSSLSHAFRARWLMWLGTIAYGLYLLHVIVLTAVFRIVLHRPPAMTNWLDALTALSAFAVTLGLAQLSWKYFESKLVRLGHRFTYWSKTSTRSSMPLSVAPTD